MAVIKKVETMKEAKTCNELLTLLVASERTYDVNIREDFYVSDFYENYYYRDDHVLFLALEKETPVGFIYAYLKEKGGIVVIENTGFVDALYIKAAYRNQGIATDLLEAVYSWCREKGITKLNLDVSIDNKDAEILYLKEGFVPHTLRMTKDLSQKLF